MSVPASLKKIVEKHLPIDTSSSRSIQRVCALFLGKDGKVTKEALHELCDGLQLFDYEGAAGRNTLAANFTQNMKKDVAYFDGDHAEGWKLTAAGKAEAKSIFTDGNAPTKRRASAKASKKTAKKAKAKKATKKASKAKPKTKAKVAKKTAAKKKATASKKTAKKASPTKATTSSADRAKKKAARRKKKRDLSKPEAKPAAATASGSSSQAW